MDQAYCVLVSYSLLLTGGSTGNNILINLDPNKSARSGIEAGKSTSRNALRPFFTSAKGMFFISSTPVTLLLLLLITLERLAASAIEMTSFEIARAAILHSSLMFDNPSRH